MQTEFEIIEKFFFKKNIKAYKGIGDDAALFKKMMIIYGLSQRIR